MKGADLLLRTAAGAGVEICFANPGTTELPIIAALDDEPRIRPVLALFEGVVTGAADGYGRMARKPALTLMHQGPSLGNGIANLHNARRARTPIVNLIGNHPLWHVPADSPLTSDIEKLASTVSGWVRTVASADTIGRDVADALHAASSGQVVSLVVPADCQSNETDSAVESTIPFPRRRASEDAVTAAARALRKKRAALLLGGAGLSTRGLRAAQRIASATGCRLLAETFPARLEWGAGLPALERVPYVPSLAQALLGGFEDIVLAGADAPVSFFVEDGIPSALIPAGVATNVLAVPTDDVEAALEDLAEALAAPGAIAVRSGVVSPAPKGGPMNAATITAAIAAAQPEGLIFVDEGVSAAGAHLRASASCAPFTYLALTGGATGQGLPCATGAAIACPDRKVLAFVGDGSAMYTVQALWTQAHEALDVVTVVLANRRYKILQLEMARKIGKTGKATDALTLLDDPRIGWTDLARAFGIPAESVDTAEALARALATAFAEKGPRLIQIDL